MSADKINKILVAGGPASTQVQTDLDDMLQEDELVYDIITWLGDRDSSEKLKQEKKNELEVRIENRLEEVAKNPNGSKNVGLDDETEQRGGVPSDEQEQSNNKVLPAYTTNDTYPYHKRPRTNCCVAAIRDHFRGRWTRPDALAVNSCDYFVRQCRKPISATQTYYCSVHACALPYMVYRPTDQSKPYPVFRVEQPDSQIRWCTNATELQTGPKDRMTGDFEKSLDLMFKDHAARTKNHQQARFQTYQTGLLEHVRLRLDAAGINVDPKDTGLCDDAEEGADTGI
jgi:hypothetical protein